MFIESKINKVTVYKDRAHVERIARVQLVPGEHTLIFGNLPFGINPDSIQVNGGNDCLLSEIKVKNVHLEKINDEEKKELFQEITELEDLIEEIKDRLNNLIEEKSLLQKFANISSESQKKTIIPLLVPDKMQEMLQFYLGKLNEIDEAIRSDKKELAKLEERLHVLKENKKNFNKNSLKQEKQAFIKVFVKTEGEFPIGLSYIVMNATWRPVYDFRLSSDEMKLNIAYHAMISQNTGEKWENISLSLSTAKPQISSIPPQLSPWFIDVFDYMPPSPKMKKSYRALAGMLNEEGFAADLSKMENELMAAPMPIQEAMVETGATSFSFSVPGNQTVLDNGEEHKIGITFINLDSRLEYHSIPRLSPYAYLTAESVNSSEFPLLAGDVNVFLDNSFVTGSAIKLVAPNQDFKTSLGIDEGVSVEYKLINKISRDEGLFSKKNKIVFEYKIALTNNKKIECAIKISDQIPLSKNQEIRVELIEPKIKENTPDLQLSDEGIIDWLFTLKPSEKIQIALKFAVEYPKGIEISGLE